MSARVGQRTVVVTDSTADLEAAEARDLDVRVVPLEVVISGHTGRDGIDVSAAQVAEALAGGEPVSTSRPSSAELVAAYEQARHDGAEGVVSVHLSSELSGTFDGARVAAREAALPVTVVDSRQVGLGLGFGVLAAAALARDGASADDVAVEARRVSHAASNVFYVDTLEYLRRGGRIGAAAAFFGGVLSVKPLLDVVDGHIEPLEKVRTSSRALARLLDIAQERAAGNQVRLGVHHLAAPDRAQAVRDALGARLPEAGPIAVRELGAVIGAHVGPGVVAVVVAPR